MRKSDEKLKRLIRTPLVALPRRCDGAPFYIEWRNMSYQVLARKYRPRTFGDVVGQDHAVRALVHALDQDRLHHAYLFTGTRGVGKTTIARIFAKCMNCEEGVTSTPCCECGACTEIAEGRFVDLIEVDAASRTRVDDTRDLLDNVQYLPSVGRFKVYLIDEVHMLSASSFNALLKTLEEPPPHVKFLLATTDPKKVPVTVLSRCLQFHLKNIPPDAIATHLADVLGNEEIPFETSALDIIATAAAGSMRDALSVADQAVGFGGGKIEEASVAELLGTVRRDEVGALLHALADNDKKKLLACAKDLVERNADLAGVLGNLQRALHDIALGQTLGADGAASDLGDLMTRFTPEDVQIFYQTALMGSRDLAFAPDERVGFEMTLIRMLAFAPVSPDGGERQTRSQPDSQATGVEATGPDPEAGASASNASAAAPVVRSANSDVPEQPPRVVRNANSDVPEQAPRVVRNANSSSESEVPEVPEVSEAPAHEPDGQLDEPPGDTGVRPEEVRAAPLAKLADLAWHEHVDAIAPSGVSAMILEHSLLTFHNEQRWVLVLDESHDTLLNDTQRTAINTLVSNYVQRPIRVDIELGKIEAETPAVRKRRLADERYQAAVTSLEADANVQALLHEFDAKLGDVKSLAE